MDIYSTHALVALVENLKRPKRHFLDTVFGQVQTEESEEIHFDIEIGKRRLAPFVSPLMQGKVVENLGYRTSTFKPAYIKPKTILDPSRPLKRAAGEQIGGTMAAANRAQMVLAMTQAEHVDMITRRLEHMATEALVDGQVTVSGEGYETHVVDFGRHNDLTISLTGTDAWDNEDSDPLEDLEEWAELVHEHEGATITDVTMDPKAGRAFRTHQKVRDLLDNRRAEQGPMQLGPNEFARGARFIGAIGNFNMWVYSEWYVDPDDGQTKPLLAEGTVVGHGPDVQGVQAFGAIRDERAGYQALPMFPKSWVEEDPPRRLLMTQSAPLVVPYRPNATFRATVLE